MSTNALTAIQRRMQMRLSAGTEAASGRSEMTLISIFVAKIAEQNKSCKILICCPLFHSSKAT